MINAKEFRKERTGVMIILKMSASKVHAGKRVTGPTRLDRGGGESR
jgi:hypothetical protein